MKDRLAVDEHLALVGRVQAVQDVHEGGLAGTVLAEQAVDLTGFDDEGAAILDELQRTKQPDWTQDDEWSGSHPIADFTDHREGPDDDTS